MIASTKIRALLLCGVLLAPIFYLVVTAQIFARSGFDIRIHPLSLLSLGSAGWIQVANFLFAGALAIGCAVGMGLIRRRGGYLVGVHWLIGSFGAGMIIAGLAPPDPMLGFPPGSPPDIPTRMSVHASFHGVGFAIAFLSLITACFLSSVTFFRAGRIQWSMYSAATGIATVALLIAGFAAQRVTSIAFFIVGIVAFGWLAAIACHLLNQSTTSQAPPLD